MRRKSLEVLACVGVVALVPTTVSVTAQARSMGPLSERNGFHWPGAVSAVSPSAAFFASDIGLDSRPRMKNWDGTSWTNARRLGGVHAFLTGIDAISPSDAWAVGSWTNHDDGKGLHSLTVHWDGHRWRVVDSGGLQQVQETDMTAISMAAPNDVWAVGYDTGGEDGPITSVIKHWDGSSWSVVPAPADGYLLAVATPAPDDVWISGDVDGGYKFLHWDGTNWTSMAAGGRITQLDAASRDDVWAVGQHAVGGEADTLIEHWDGASWTVVPSPSPGGSTGTILNSVSAVSPDDVWAAGYSIRDIYYPGDTLIEHWDGQEWSVVPSPSPGQRWNGLTGISGDSATDAWASGTYSNHSDPDQGKTLLLDWDGTSWKRFRDVR